MVGPLKRELFCGFPKLALINSFIKKINLSRAFGHNEKQEKLLRILFIIWSVTGITNLIITLGDPCA